MKGRDEATGHARGARRAGTRRSPLPPVGTLVDPWRRSSARSVVASSGRHADSGGEEGPEEELRYTGDVGDSQWGWSGLGLELP